MIDRPSFDAVGFDLDDTLFDFEQYIRAGLAGAAALVERHTGRDLHAELVDLYFEEGITDGTFDALIERQDLPEELLPDLVDAYHASIGPLEPYPDAEPVLDALAPAYRLGLLTDGRNGQAKLSRLGLADRFDAVVVAPNHDLSKTDPRSFELLLDGLDVEPVDAVYVGDNPVTDFAGANELGITTVRLVRGRFSDRSPTEEAAPDFQVTSLRELPRLLGL